jgi:hypothetical protein
MTAPSDPQATLRTTREFWLEQAIDSFRPRFIEVGFALADRYHVSVGFGYGAKRENAKLEGQSWSRTASADDIGHIFISPEIGDTSEVLRVLLHELIHHALDSDEGIRDGHKGDFAEIATRFGFTGPMTETPASPTLQAEFFVIAEVLGGYPHGALEVARAAVRTRSDIPVTVGGPRVHTGPKTQTNRHIKCECPCCGYAVRTTAKWIMVGVPRCPAGTKMLVLTV